MGLGFGTSEVVVTVGGAVGSVVAVVTVGSIVLVGAFDGLIVTTSESPLVTLISAQP